MRNTFWVRLRAEQLSHCTFNCENAGILKVGIALEYQSGGHGVSNLWGLDQYSKSRLTGGKAEE